MRFPKPLPPGPSRAARAAHKHSASVEKPARIGRHKFQFLRRAICALRIEGSWCSLQHVADIRGRSWIGKHRGFEIIDGEVVADREDEQVDDFISMRPD